MPGDTPGELFVDAFGVEMRDVAAVLQDSLGVQGQVGVTLELGGTAAAPTIGGNAFFGDGDHRPVQGAAGAGAHRLPRPPSRRERLPLAHRQPGARGGGVAAARSGAAEGGAPADRRAAEHPREGRQRRPGADRGGAAGRAGRRGPGGRGGANRGDVGRPHGRRLRQRESRGDDHSRHRRPVRRDPRTRRVPGRLAADPVRAGDQRRRHHADHRRNPAGEPLDAGAQSRPGGQSLPGAGGAQFPEPHRHRQSPAPRPGHQRHRDRQCDGERRDPLLRRPHRQERDQPRGSHHPRHRGHHAHPPGESGITLREPVPRLAPGERPSAADGRRRVPPLERGEHPARWRDHGQQGAAGVSAGGHALGAPRRVHAQVPVRRKPRVPGAARNRDVLRHAGPERRARHHRRARCADGAGRRDPGHREHHRHAAGAAGRADDDDPSAASRERAGLLPRVRPAVERRARDCGQGQDAGCCRSPSSPAPRSASSSGP